ncbi:unnamed protein product [Phytophthora lilii]|uniref:Unnamed protein product n=1 Tax=Phytophthora lilii TaxID=2077276 RepID=A0A9W6TQ18_9STRA|nr:unnamed protein product [Phytophthora lilii]
MMTPDENMSSTSGGSLRSPGIPSAGVFMATAVPDEQMRAPEQPATYVPVAAYPPTYAAGPQPGATAPASAAPQDQALDEEMKAEVPGADDLRMGRQAEEQAMPRQALRDAQRQIAELQMAMAARDEQERIRLQAYQQTLQAQTAKRDLNRAERKQQKSLTRKQEIEEARRKEAANIEIASLQIRLHQVQEQQAWEQDARRSGRSRRGRSRACAPRGSSSQARAAASASRRAGPPGPGAGAPDAQEAELRSLREQVAAVAERSRARERSTSPGSTDRAGATRQRRPRRNARSRGHQVERNAPEGPITEFLGADGATMGRSPGMRNQDELITAGMITAPDSIRVATTTAGSQPNTGGRGISIIQ